MWQVRGQVLLTHLDQIGWEKRRNGEKGKPAERGRKRAFKVRSSHFSLDFPMIVRLNLDETRGKVDPQCKSYK